MPLLPPVGRPPHTGRPERMCKMGSPHTGRGVGGGGGVGWGKVGVGGCRVHCFIPDLIGVYCLPAGGAQVFVTSM